MEARMFTTEPTTIEHVPARQWAAWQRDNDAIIIDVREPMEWTLGTLPGSETISLGQLPSALGDRDRDTAILLVCATGSRSTTGAAWLASMGFTKVASLAGGVVALGMA